METTSARIRPARPEEAETLSALVLRSKAHWGYDEAFLEACRDELRITREMIASGHVAVLEEEGQLLGVSALSFPGETAELERLFVEPDRIGRGYGRRLWRDAVARARGAGAERLVVQSDPQAEGFYARMGAERVGEAPSASIPGRVLPVLEAEL